MPKIMQEETIEYKAQIATMFILNPRASILSIQNALEKNGTHLDKNYIHKLIKEIRAERAERYLNIGKDEVIAEFEDLMSWIQQQARQVLREEIKIFNEDNSLKQKFISQANRVKALKLILETADKAIGIKMDLGIFERQLGRIKGDHSVITLMAALKQYEKRDSTTEAESVHGQRSEKITSSEKGKE